MSNNKQQTAVEWLWRWINDNQEATIEQGNKAFQQAKEMEKEQIIEAFEIGIQSEFFHQTFNAPCKDGEQYYTETYKQ
jgi:hypothetical protein